MVSETSKYRQEEHQALFLSLKVDFLYLVVHAVTCLCRDVLAIGAIPNMLPAVLSEQLRSLDRQKPSDKHRKWVHVIQYHWQHSVDTTADLECVCHYSSYRRVSRGQYDELCQCSIRRDGQLLQLSLKGFFNFHDYFVRSTGQSSGEAIGRGVSVFPS